MCISSIVSCLQASSLSLIFFHLTFSILHIFCRLLHFILAFLLSLSFFICSFLPNVSPHHSPLSCFFFLSCDFCVESTTVEFVLLPLIGLVLIFLPSSRSSAEWMNFFNCLSESHLHCTAQLPPRFVTCHLPWNNNRWMLKCDFYGSPLLRPVMISCLTGCGMSSVGWQFNHRKQSYKVLTQ